LHFRVGPYLVLALPRRATGSGSGGPTARTLGRACFVNYSSFVRVAEVFARGSVSQFVFLIEDTGDGQVRGALHVYHMGIVVEATSADSFSIRADFTEE
jgi:hypothetical protein